MTLASPLVGLEVGREGLLELQRNALAHHADRVDGVDERIHVGVKQIAACFDEVRHHKYHPRQTAAAAVDPTVVSAGASLPVALFRR